jgi:two-component system, OmpR family, alkaline phosphatase synthesis response regulator PhoP
VKKDLKIVIVEDNAAIIEMYEYKLRYEGFTILKATDGIMGYEMAEKYKPDLLLLDLMLPYLQGHELLKRIRDTDWGKHIKVIVLTNVNEDEAPDDLGELNIDAYIIKAVTTPKDIYDVINSLFPGLN